MKTSLEVKELMSSIVNAEEFFKKYLEMKCELRQKTGELEAKNALIRQMVAEIQSLKMQTDTLRDKYKAAYNDNIDSVNRFENLLKKFSAAQTNHEEIVIKLSQRIENYKAELVLEEQRSEKDNEIKKLKQTIEAKHKRIERLTDDMRTRDCFYYKQIREKDQELFCRSNYIGKLEHDVHYFRNLLHVVKGNLEMAEEQHEMKMRQCTTIIEQLEKSVSVSLVDKQKSKRSMACSPSLSTVPSNGSVLVSALASGANARRRALNNGWPIHSISSAQQVQKYRQ